MKKVIALALAMAMALSMTAMAADFGVVTPADHEDSGARGADEMQMLPGEEYHFVVEKLGAKDVAVGEKPDHGDYIAASGDLAGSVVTSKNFSISTKWGKNDDKMVESVKFDSDHDACIVVTLKENYTIEDLKTLEGTVTLKTKRVLADAAGNGAIAKGTEYELELNDFVANDVVLVDGRDKKDDAEEIDVLNNTIYKMDNSGWVKFCTSSDLGSVLVRLPEGKKVFAYYNEDAIDEIEDKYYDLDADINYINFVAKPNLGQKAEVAIQGDYSDKYYLYEYVGGKLNEIKADWDEEDGLFEFTTTKLGSYVISDKALVAEADEAEDEDKADETTESKNPDTGANDVVGVAVALAAVSLVAAGAVSLKK